MWQVPRAASRSLAREFWICRGPVGGALQAFWSWCVLKRRGSLVDAKILDAQASDGRGHPAILVAMIVNAAGLADLPADGHAIEDFVLENEVAGVIALGEEEVFVEGFGANDVSEDVVLHVLQRELALGYAGESTHPFGDNQLIGGGLLLHQAPPNGNPRTKRTIMEL